MGEVVKFEAVRLKPAAVRLVAAGLLLALSWSLGQVVEGSTLAQAGIDRGENSAKTQDVASHAAVDGPSSEGGRGSVETAGQLVFHDSFDDPASGWGTVVSKQGLVEYRDGKLVIRINGRDVPAVSVHGGVFGDVVIDVEASTLGGPMDNALGIALRYQDADNYYAFMISADGYYGILRWVDAAPVFDQPWLYDENGVIARGVASNRLRVVASGELLRFYVNGEMLGEVRDSRWGQGQVGVFAASLSEPNVLVGFDDWYVWEPSGRPSASRPFTDEPAGGERFLTMLELVPDDPLALAGAAGVSYVDLQAVLRAAGVENPRTLDAYRQLPQEQRELLLEAVGRVSAGPHELVFGFSEQVEEMPSLLGFEWFDVEAALSFGEPPETSVVLAVEFDENRVGESLSRRGFESRDAGGVTIWHRGEDGRVELANREPGDPFGGPLGKSQRIAMLPGHLANSAFWDGIQAVARTLLGSESSLAQSADIRTLVGAADAASAGELVQAVFLHPLQVGLVPQDPVEATQAGAANAHATSEANRFESLPLYELALLADKQEAGEQVNVIALLYRNEEAAVAASRELNRRLLAFMEERFPRTSFRLDEPNAHQGEAGLWAAVAAVRIAPGEGGGAVAPGGFGDWLRAVAGRDFPVLALTP